MSKAIEVATAVFVAVSGYTKRLCFPPEERVIVVAGQRGIQSVPVKSIKFVDGIYIARGEVEIERLRKHPYNEANGGRVYRELSSIQEAVETVRAAHLQNLPPDPRDEEIARLRAELEAARSSSPVTGASDAGSLLAELEQEATALSAPPAAPVVPVVETPDTPAGVSEDEDAPGLVFEGATTATEAAEVLVGLHVPISELKSPANGRLSKERIRAAAEKAGVQFPNLED